MGMTQLANQRKQLFKLFLVIISPVKGTHTKLLITLLMLLMTVAS